MKVSIIIPAYNEAEGVVQTAAALRPVLAELRQKFTVEIIFVNDGSNDSTASLLHETFKESDDVRILSHETNHGLGAALRTGFEYATGDIVVTTDFDGTYVFATIPHLIDQLLSENVDIVTASPYHPQGRVEGVPKYRLLFSLGASTLYRLLVSPRIHTWTALFRSYRRQVIKTVPFVSDDFLAGTELLVNAMRNGYTVAEYPTTLRVRTFGQSSIKIARVTRSHLLFQMKLIIASLQGTPNVKPVQFWRKS